MCITKAELEKKAKKHKALKAKAEKLKNEIKEVEQEIIEYMTENKLSEEFTTTSKITYKEQSRITLDKDGLMEIFGDDLKPYEKITSYNVLRVK